MRKIKAGGNSMDERQRATLIRNMTDNLPTLRKRMDISQAEFAALIGVSRSTLAAIENQKRPMTWNMFLALLLIFTKNKETDKLLNAMEIYTDELNGIIKHREQDGGQNHD